MKAIKNELKATLKELSTPRKTVIEHEIEEVKVEVSELVAKEEVYLIITRDGYIKRMTPKAYNSNEETKLKEGDLIVAEYKATTLDTLLMFTNLGNYVYLPIQKIPEVRHRDLGYNVSTLVTIDPNERVVHTMAVEDFEADIYLLFTTKNGLIKRVPLKNYVAFRYSKSLLATKLRAGDELVSVDCGPNDSDVVVITKEGYINRYKADEIPPMAPPAYGVKALEMKNRPGDEVIGGHYLPNRGQIVILTSRDYIKRVNPDDVPLGRKTTSAGSTRKSSGRTPITSSLRPSCLTAVGARTFLLIWREPRVISAVPAQTIKDANLVYGKKINLSKIGGADSIIFVRDNNDNCP